MCLHFFLSHILNNTDLMLEKHKLNVQVLSCYTKNLTTVAAEGHALCGKDFWAIASHFLPWTISCKCLSRNSIIQSKDWAFRLSKALMDPAERWLVISYSDQSGCQLGIKKKLVEVSKVWCLWLIVSEHKAHLLWHLTKSGSQARHGLHLYC